jgi:hypothetical protein
MIDDEAEPAIQERLTAIRLSLQINPQAHLEALQAFAVDPENVPEDSIWRELTDRHHPVCQSYWFDDDTQQAIRRDSTHRLMRAQEGGQGHLLRSRGLEIFLGRLIAAQQLGKVSITATE